jgi:hypothetical protein
MFYLRVNQSAVTSTVQSKIAGLKDSSIKLVGMPFGPSIVEGTNDSAVAKAFVALQSQLADGNMVDAFGSFGGQHLYQKSLPVNGTYTTYFQ